ncbi:antitoxin of type II TA system, VapB [Mucilaginibacter mallensis]|uniref:Antitoxin of type II TA system, VapB n=1 Tax=Mucilaginibacter mallensis TaxID=652787 RepID=A0A1H2B6R6_MUCMA|nr:type II toxin-antitoxin system VapB family antitoxin [Mucilaginibacter mallensis]SDT53891.1 antitoxin of type II TA system, VapB [Mucilaginibacter mallensis]
MRTNIEIDEALIAKAQMLTNIQDKNIIIEQALQLYISFGGSKNLRQLKKYTNQAGK